MGAALAPLDSTRSAGLVIVFSLFIAACAQFAIHIGPVPITGQSFAVLLTGALLGSRLGAAAVIAYLIEGAIGLPFFAPGGAPGILAVSLVQPAVISWRFRLRLSSPARLLNTVGTSDIQPQSRRWLSVLRLFCSADGPGIAILTNTPPMAAFKLAVLPFLCR